MKLLPLFLLCACAGQTRQVPPPNQAPSRYLYVWAGDKDEEESDFIVVVDVDSASPTYTQVVSTVPVGFGGSLPHHLEYELPPTERLLFGNAHHHERILLFDTRDAAHPRLVKSLPPTPPFRYPHDFARLPNGNVLVGFLRSDGPSPMTGDTNLPGGHGGIAELDPEGRLLRQASAADPSISMPVRPYAFAVLPDVDRLITTSAAMMEDQSADVVQIWRLSDLGLLRTLPLPPAWLEDGKALEDGHRLPFEPRVLRDGRSVFLNAYGCGLYLLTGIDSAEPWIRNVYTIEVSADELGACGVPILLRDFWIMPVGSENMLVTLDIRNPGEPVEVSRLMADSLFHPHWLAKDPGSNRLIVGAELGGEDRMLMARVDPSSGHLSWDESFRTDTGELGIDFRRLQWPHGMTGEAFGHAALFRP
jgi:hypothetical protein